MLKNYLLIAYKVLMRRKFFTFISLFGISFTLMILVVSVAFLDNSFTPQKPESKFDRVLWMPRWRMRSPDRGSNWNASGGFYTISICGELLHEPMGQLKPLRYLQTQHR
jgi:hypothetical protein